MMNSTDIAGSVEEEEVEELTIKYLELFSKHLEFYGDNFCNYLAFKPWV